MKRRYFHLALLLTLGLLSSPTYAEETKDAQEAAVLEARRQQIHELVMIRLNNALELTPAQSEQISQVLRKFRREKTEDRNKIRLLSLKLREVSGSGNEAQIQGLIQQITAAKTELDKVDDQMFAEARKHLNTKQQAQFIFVMEEIRREVQAVKRGGPPPGGIMPSGGNMPPGSNMLNTFQGGGSKSNY